MVVLGIVTINRMSKIQQNLDTHLDTGILKTTDTGELVYTSVASSGEIHYCPLCGNNVDDCNYCSRCGCCLQ